MKIASCLGWVAALGAAAAFAPGCMSQGTFTDQMKCTTDAECDDGDPCTRDTCEAGSCKHPSAGAGTTCGGGLTCDGAGKCAACAADADCGGATACASFTCASHACKATYAPAGTMLADDKHGDCMRPSCDGHGAVVQVADTSDAPASPDACTVSTCGAQGPTQSSAPMGSTCSAGVCNGGGKCVACNVASDCTTPSDAYCYANQCASCSDGMQDGDETNVDCGGSNCGKCGGEPCTAPSDCHTNSCTVTSSGDKCGWPANVACMHDSECASAHCDSGFCTAP